MRLIACFLMLFGILFVSSVNATTYFVDFDSGDDSNDGISEMTSWKHAPGDSNATLNPQNIVLNPGDVVSFKGGVSYRGAISMKFSGTEAAPIIYKGNVWGTEKAIINGADIMSVQWNACQSADEVDGNPNWQNIYYASYDSDLSPFNQFFENGTRVYISQTPNMSDPFWDDNINEYNTVLNGNITITSLKDDQFFTQSTSDFWDGAYIQMWVNPNVIEIRKINSLDPTTHTVYYDALADNAIYGTRDQYYSIVNHLSALDRPGEYVIDETHKKIYYWPKGSINDCVLSCGTRSYGLGINGHSNLIIEGFKVQGNTDDGSASAIWNNRAWGEPSKNIIIRNNEITHIRTKNGRKGAIMFGNVDGALIENNYIHECQRNSGILLGVLNVTVRNNIIDKVGYKGLWSMDSEHLRIHDNIFSNCIGTHGNAVSIFTTNNCVFAGNKLTGRDGEILTYAGNEDFVVCNNLIVSDVIDGYKTGTNLIRENNDSGTGYNIIVNNTVLNSKTGFGLGFSVHSNATGKQYVINNIADGGGDFRLNNISNNIYTSLSWRQSSSDWEFSEGEFLVEDFGTLFVDPEAGDYTLVSDSPARNAGIDLNQVLPQELKDLFPDFDFTVDMNGNIRGADGTWDIGVYEYAGEGDIQAPGIPLNLSGIAASQTVINLSWTPSSDNVGVAGYRIYRNGSEIGTSNASFYNDTGLSAQTVYSYRVSAYDAAGNESELCVAVDVSTLEAGINQCMLDMRFNGDLTDLSDNSFVGQWIGSPSYGPGILDQSIDLSGSLDNYVTIARDDRLGGMTQLHIKVVAKKKDASIGGRLFVKHMQYSMQIGASSVNAYVFNSEGARLDLSSSSLSAINNTMWHTFEIILNGNSAKLLVDGVVSDEKLFAGQVVLNTSYDLFIGKDPWGSAFNGNIDSFAIYNNTNSSNQSPIISPVSAINLYEGETVRFNIYVTDENAGDIISVITENLPSGATLTQAEERIWQFNWATDFESAGTYAPIFMANDGEINSYPLVVDIIIGDVNSSINLTNKPDFFRTE